jgi:hypothetical protein
LSGNGNNGTFQNGGPSFNTNGWLSFDGTDDFIQIPDSATMSNTSSLSICALVRYNSLSSNFQAIIGKGSGSSPDANEEYVLTINNSSLYFDVGQGSGPYIQPSLSLSANRWYHISATHTRTNGTSSLTAYSNGVALTATTLGALNTPNNNDYPASIGRRAYSGFPYGNDTLNGDLASIQLYLKTLSATEVLQNYYGGPIVTDGLVFAVDAGNLVSYPKSGTSVYSLTGSITSTLTNGTGFSSVDGGTWTFDGVDDYIDLSSDPWPANAFTNDSVSIWFKFSNYGVILGQNAGVPFSLGGYVPAIYIDTSFYLRTSMFWGGSTGNQSVSPSPLSINTWYNVTVTNGSNIQKTYLNGELIATLSKTQASYAGAYYYTLGAGVWTSWGGSTGSVGYLQGQIANLYYYDKELTAAEVLQNYNATK